MAQDSRPRGAQRRQVQGRAHEGLEPTVGALQVFQEVDPCDQADEAGYAQALPQRAAWYGHQGDEQGQHWVED
eukprot:1826372-Pyramimonas_sp.AAC.1